MSNPDGSSSSSKGMDWMYKGPTALVDREDYLLGRKVDKSFQLLEAQEKGEGRGFSYADEVEKDLTPASIFSSKGQLSTAGPVDIVRKIKEDPLYQIEKKEQETLKQLLQNPIKLKQLQKLATEKKAASKKLKKHSTKKSKRRNSSSSSDSDSLSIDKLLAAKISALKKKSSKKNNSSSSSSSSDSSSDDEKKKDTPRKPHGGGLDRERSSYNHQRNYSSSRVDRGGRRYDRDSRDRSRDMQRGDSSRRGDRGRFRSPPPPRDRDRRRSRSPPNRPNNRNVASSSSTSSSFTRPQPEKRNKLSEEEMERKRREMMDNAKVRDEDRRKNVERWREEQKEEEEEMTKHHDSDFIRKHLLTAADEGSVEKRIKSNSYNIQKSSSAMSQNFARR